MTSPSFSGLLRAALRVGSPRAAGLTTSLATGLFAAIAAFIAAGCASEPERAPPPRPSSSFEEPAPAGPVAAGGSRPRGAVGPAGSSTPSPAGRPAPPQAGSRPAPGPAAPASPASAHPDDELAPGPAPAASARGGGPAGDEAGETDAQRVARLEREAERGGGETHASPDRGRPSTARGVEPEDADRGRGRPTTGRGGGDEGGAGAALTLDKDVEALLQRANDAVGKDWAAYADCFSVETQRLLVASWGVTIGVAAWSADQKTDQNSKGAARILWLRCGKSGITRQSIMDVVEGRSTPRQAVEALREARRDPKQTIGELGPALPFSGNDAFLAVARIQGSKGKGAGATVTVRGPEGTTVLELQHASAGGFVLHVKDTDAWLARLDRALTARIAAKE
jgi:hypothetical protein